MLRRSAQAAGLALIALAVIGTGGWINLHAQQQPAPSVLLPAGAENGDLVFRKGRGMWSPYFALLNAESGFSHVGVLVRQNSQRWGVIHAEADDDGRNGAVKLSSLSDFVNESAGYEIRRNTMPSEDKQRFAAAVLGHWIRATPFDSSFRLDDEGKNVYCTELIWLAGQAAGNYRLGDIHILAGKGVITVDSIYQSPWLGDAKSRAAAVAH